MHTRSRTQRIRMRSCARQVNRQVQSLELHYWNIPQHSSCSRTEHTHLRRTILRARSGSYIFRQWLPTRSETMLNIHTSASTLRSSSFLCSSFSAKKWLSRHKIILQIIENRCFITCPRSQYSSFKNTHACTYVMRTQVAFWRVDVSLCIKGFCRSTLHNVHVKKTAPACQQQCPSLAKFSDPSFKIQESSRFAGERKSLQTWILEQPQVTAPVCL